MANRWKINAEEPSKLEKYDWHVPNDEQQHVQETSSPGALRIKPKDISLKPTISPKRSGVQSGSDFWDFVSDPQGTEAWYVQGS